ncbi:mechanosensitive ion channel [Candidatus Woesearchaeota archaeon]|nr:mechanosensitive ion channel [Candidatus Woesearchaeota archaeon]
MAEWLSNLWGYSERLVSGLLNNLIVAVVIILIGFILGRVLGKLVQKVLHELEIDRILKKTAKIKFSFEKALAKFIAYFVYFVAIIIALNQLGLTTTILHMISAAVLIIIVLSIILGVKDFIPNFLAGVHISRNRIIKEGDRIKIKGTEGEVTEVDLTEVKVRTKSGDIIFIPASLFVKEEFVKLGRKRNS